MLHVAMLQCCKMHFFNYHVIVPIEELHFLYWLFWLRKKLWRKPVVYASQRSSFKSTSHAVGSMLIGYNFSALSSFLYYSLLNVFWIYSSESIASIEIASIKPFIWSANSVQTRTLWLLSLIFSLTNLPLTILSIILALL